MSIEWQNFFADRTRHITGSQIRQFFALTERPEVISFAGGFPGNDYFPLEEISDSLTLLIKEDGRQALQYGPTEGSYELRELLADKMCRDGMPCESGNLVVTDGSQQGLDMISRILINAGDPVLVEEPAYIGGMSAIKSYGGIPVGISMDADGPIPGIMEQTIEKLAGKGRTPKIYYTVPNFQNPTGITTSRQRRCDILNIAYRHNIIIVEDNPYGDLCYEGDVPDSYKSMDDQDQVIYLGSFSKVLIPGIRVGWLAGPGPLVEKVTLAKQTADLCSSSLGQQLVFRLSKDGFIDQHIQKLTDLYRRKRDTMVDSMLQFFPSDISFGKPKGGFFIWVNFPHYYPSSRELLNLALSHNVAFVHGEGFSSNGGGRHSARFSFSQANNKQIASGIKTLGELFAAVKTNRTITAVSR